VALVYRSDEINFLVKVPFGKGPTKMDVLGGDMVNYRNIRQPDLPLAFSMMAGAVLLALFFACLQRWSGVKGSLEYSTMNTRALQAGRQYLYRRLDHEADAHQTRHERLLNHFRVQANLAGWSQAMISSEEAAMAQCRTGSVTERPKRSERLRNELHMLLVSIWHALQAMNVFLAVFSFTAAFLIVGVGAMGAFLLVGIAHMPYRGDDSTATELCWQTLNGIFIILGAWAAPQRVSLLFDALLDHFAVTVDGVARSLIMPGVLLTRRQVRVVAWLRICNVVFTYLCAFFMWGWLPRCIAQNLQTHKDCTTKPGANTAIPICMVLALCTNIAAAVVLDVFTNKCEYVSWPSTSTMPNTALLTSEVEWASQQLHS